MPRQKSPVLGDKPDSGERVRKRTRKACDRCRMKKAKCDGITPCEKCRVDNTMCMFGERRRPRDKVYPTGYTKLLEEQQEWLIYGIQELYRRAHVGEGWPGEPLNCEANGQPLTHDILARLGALNQGERKYFRDDQEAMQPEFYERSNGITERPESSNGSPHGLTPVQALPATPNYTLSSLSPIRAQAVEAELAFLPLPIQDVIDPMIPTSLQDQFNLLLRINHGKFDERDLTDPSSHAILLNNDIEMSSSMVGRSPASDWVAPPSLTNTWYDPHELGQLFNPASTELLSTWFH
ncbi:C6 transcription factor (Fcr1) [Penicillium frequentans]|uniref:C6 transcription factor (Fcr1) n=1 Tax=Penicillium frequentans TaxID=3151616 RepID=A0AAD6CY58_9EURO|nr:C6 transcription factor (Fcr1) [Penicillium glabrum]KAJ5557743.1 C6 transcription factor (Fcr1) [Penicillium glabrum]